MDLLDTPLRGTWDLGGTQPHLDRDQAVCAARRLGDAGLFYLTLEGQALAHPAFREVLEELDGAGVQTSLVYSAREAERSRLGSGLPLAKLWLDADAFIEKGAVDDRALEDELSLLRERGYDPRLLLVPMRENLHLLQELVALCGRLGVGSFKLPNVPVDGNFPAAAERLIRSVDLNRLAAGVRDAGESGSEVKLEIHDRFLWEILSTAQAVEHSEYGGCQAANSLVHVDCRGDVRPCSSWAQRLGNILESGLEQIWDGPARLEVRREIEVEPPGCRACGDYALCRGACRGLGRSFNRSGGERDPACSGPR